MVLITIALPIFTFETTAAVGCHWFHHNHHHSFYHHRRLHCLLPAVEHPLDTEEILLADSYRIIPYYLAFTFTFTCGCYWKWKKKVFRMYLKKDFHRPERITARQSNPYFKWRRGDEGWLQDLFSAYYN